jgi:crotonobetaine/carnitine-CoA ligase
MIDAMQERHVPAAVDLTFRELIGLRAQEHADAPFCFFGDDVITFGGFKDCVEQMAAMLASGGVREGCRVALMLPNCPEHIALFFALSRIGAVAVPFSIHLRQSGLELQLASARPHHVIADASYVELARALGSAASVESVIWHGPALPHAPGRHRNLLLSGLRPAASEAGAVAEREDSLNQICAISYTSGTTGAPKGAMLNQRWFQTGAKNAGILADVRRSDVLFLWEPFYHVAGWMTVLICLQHAVPMAMVEKFSASGCWQQIRRYRATLFHYLGGAMNLLLKQPQAPGDGENPVRIAWGAAAPAHSWHEFESRFGVKIREGYGITEAGNFTMLNLDGPAGSIGTPVEEFEAWIENGQGLRADAQEVGEIVLRPKIPGVVMNGYFDDPARSAEVLRNGCVYTGDLGYRDAAGNFYFSGRKKEALRRRGENVSAWEVERIINAHPDVEESAVIGVASEMGEQDIMAYVKPAPDKAVQPLQIIRWCEQHLAYYQIPRYIRLVDDFPRGPTQRIRKQELAPDTAAAWDFEASGEMSNAHRV